MTGSSSICGRILPSPCKVPADKGRVTSLRVTSLNAETQDTNIRVEREVKLSTQRVRILGTQTFL